LPMLHYQLAISCKLLFLLMIANGAPILLNKWLGRRYAWPVDGGLRFFDRRPLFGPSKTLRGMVAAVALTGPVATVLGIPFELGLLVGGSAMLGDLFSSFFKRRLGMPPSGMAIGLDQIPEALFPLLAVRSELALEQADIFWLVMLFLLLELVVSRILFALHIRDQPH
jgi:hypothetical protein